MKKLSRMLFALGALTLVAMLLSALALNDIAHGNEPDYTMEWNAVRVSYLLNLMFVALALGFTWRMNRRTDET
jgi:uncharacterized BrkB/YihY/UPF0761 family membrane protein